MRLSENIANSLPNVVGPFRSALGSSVVEEFVAGHSSSDVLRELVQNEYDGREDRLEVVFEIDGIHVSGTGETINQEGWRRLEVLLGTGESYWLSGTRTHSVQGQQHRFKKFRITIAISLRKPHLPELGSQRVLDPSDS